MADLLSDARQVQTSGSPGTGPRRRGHGTWLSVVALAVGLAAVVTLLAVIGQSAGAAGGCGGG